MRKIFMIAIVLIVTLGAGVRLANSAVTHSAAAASRLNAAIDAAG